MPHRNKNRRHPSRRPNVFVQTEPSSRRDQSTSRRDQSTDQTPETAAAEPSPVLAATAAAVARQRPAGARRTQRTRSEVYARTFPREIRKMAILSAGIVITLAVFTIVL